ncbi:MAG: 16S rRNA (guanine(966)-N(2))-methyltransferase RsmD [Oscillospiraceae bacterium]|nr:16S rRNA (guanine(966)-N(2))-methyltransferase RsmD [Oscillospiraceae bacterium]
MRVISGTCRGRKLLEPAGMDVRPTTDQVKEALFNIIQFDIEGRKALDLFAGTGQLGIEALSRGAASCTFVDASRTSLKLVQENLRRCGLTAAVVQSDSIAFLRRGEKFDLIFLDPPYGMGLEEQAVRDVKEFDILSKGGIMVCETRADTAVPDPGADYGSVKTYRYGRIRLTVITRGG